MSTTVSGAAGSDKANESRGAVAKTKDPAPSPTAPSSAPRRIAAKAKPDMPPKVQSLLIGIVIVMLAYLIGIYNPTNIRFVEPRHSRTSCDVDSWSLKNLKPQPVPRFKWDPTIPFAAKLSSWREPVILTNTFVTQWRALQTWASDAYFAHVPEMSMLNDTMVVHECQMKPANKKNALGAAGLVSDTENNFYSFNTSGHVFLSQFNNPNDNHYWYWYGKVEGSLLQDVQPNEGLWVDKHDEEQFGLFMWLSGPDIGPWWHYDQDHNFYVQVAGTKRFMLVPPWEYKAMHLFPQIHPRNHKSQVDFDHPDFGTTPNYQNLSEIYVAELEPGEVLYIPPYYFHHVRSHTRSVSLASWSQSGVFRKMRYGLYERKFAFDTLEAHDLKRMAFRFFLQEIAQQIYGSRTEYFRQLIQQRWEPIRSEIDENTGDIDLETLCGDLETDKTLSDDLKADILGDVRAAIEAFETCQTKTGAGDKGIGIERRDMKAIRDVEFGDFIEFFLSDVVGATHVLPFLDHCLANSPK